MINFIVVDDIEFFTQQVQNTITKFSFKIEHDIKIYSFNEYNTEFRKISNSKLENKIYILDIETKNNNGIDEAKKIRKRDKNSPIIFITIYEKEYGTNLLRSGLNFTFVSKCEDIGFNASLFKTLKNIYDENYNFEKLQIDDDERVICNIECHTILYIYSNEGKTKVKTDNSEIIIPNSLTSLLTELPDYFFQTHRGCIVNLRNIICIDKKITFNDGTRLDKISKYKKKSLIEAYKKENNMI